MSKFICLNCEKEFDDLDEDEIEDCDCIREEGLCEYCAGFEED